MLWKVRTRIGDRPGTLARLAARCGERGVNILGLQIFPTPDGVVDELVLSTPTRWSDIDVVDLLDAAGGTEVSATACSLRTLQDPAVRYLQAVSLLRDSGRSLVAALEELLETGTPDAADYVGHDELRVRAPDGREAVLRRAVRFTPTERARAQALSELVAQVCPRPSAVPSPTTPAARSGNGDGTGADGRAVLVRTARPSDVDELVGMHRRCSPRTLAARYHSDEEQRVDVADLTRMQVESGLPTLVAVVDDRVVGVATSRPGTDSSGIRCGLLVEDGWQRQGVGVALLAAAARAAVTYGATELVLVARPGNDALLRTVGRCGFTARLRRVDGNLGLTIALTQLASTVRSARTGTLV